MNPVQAEDELMANIIGYNECFIAPRHCDDESIFCEHWRENARAAYRRGVVAELKALEIPGCTAYRFWSEAQRRIAELTEANDE